MPNSLREERVIFVEVMHGYRQFEVEVNLEAPGRRIPKEVSSSDQDLLIKALCEKKPGLAHLFRSEECTFSVESKLRPGRFVEMGFKSPIKYQALRYLLTLIASQPLRTLNSIDSCYLGKLIIFICILAVIVIPLGMYPLRIKFAVKHSQ